MWWWGTPWSWSWLPWFSSSAASWSTMLPGSATEVFVKTARSLNTRAECSRVEERRVLVSWDDTREPFEMISNLRHWGHRPGRGARWSHCGVLSYCADFRCSCFWCVWAVPWWHPLDRAVPWWETDNRGSPLGAVGHTRARLLCRRKPALLVPQRGLEAVLPLKCRCHDIAQGTDSTEHRQGQKVGFFNFGSGRVRVLKKYFGSGWVSGIFIKYQLGIDISGIEILIGYSPSISLISYIF